MRVPFDVALERPRDPVTLAAVNLVDYMLEPRLGRKHMVKNGAVSTNTAVSPGSVLVPICITAGNTISSRTYELVPFSCILS